jgi:predicted Zn-dependent protease
MAQSLGLISAIQVLVGDTGGLVALAGELFTLAAVNSYSQEQEHEADAQAVALMIRAGLDANALAEFFEQLKTEAPDVPDVLSWFSTHPDTDARIQAVNRLVADSGRSSFARLQLDWSQIKSKLKNEAKPVSEKSISFPSYPREARNP